MNKPNAIKKVCEVVSLAHKSRNPEGSRSDGFCFECSRMDRIYNISDETLKYVEQAVKRALVADGHIPADATTEGLPELPPASLIESREIAFRNA